MDMVDLPTDGNSPLKVVLKIDGDDSWLGTDIRIVWHLNNDGKQYIYHCPIENWLSEDTDEGDNYMELSNCQYWEG